MSTDAILRGSIERVSGSYVADGVLLAFCLLTFGLLDPSLNTTSGIAASLQQVVNEGAPNIVNQLVWLAIAGVGSFAVSRNPARFRALVVAVWPLVVVFSYCLVSASWSDQPVISLRRCFGLIVPTFCVLAAVSAIDRPERAARIVYFSFWVALLGNLMSLPFAGSVDTFGYFKGITSNKNTLGGMGALAVLSGLALLPILRGLGQRILLLLYLAAWAGLLFLSVSKTSVALAAGIPVLFAILAFVSLCLRTSVSVVVLILISISGLLFAFLGVSTNDIVRLFLRDTSFSGRTEIWTFMLDFVERHWLVGTGFASFWGAGSKSPNLYASVDFVRLLNQAHNGYLDLAATLGVVGLLLVTVLSGHAMRTADALRHSLPWLYRYSWFILLFFMIHNTMESSFLVPFALVWHVMLLTYILAARMACEERR